jgi:ribosomal protein S12 methylthiotransferase accessory factor
LVSAVDTLQWMLSERFRAAGLGGRPPRVVSLGVDNVLDVAADPAAARRQRATVHVTSSGVLVGPWGAGGGCGHCLALRWQQLRAEYLRIVLEYGANTTAAGDWPLVTGYLADAVFALYRGTVLTRADARPAGSMVSQLDPHTLAVQGFPLLADPLCPSCGPGEGEPVAPGRPELTTGRKVAPDNYRLRRPEDYPLPTEALVNPVTGLLGSMATKHLMTPTTAPVFGSILMHGEGGLAEMTWCGQANSYRRSRYVGVLEGIERYAGTRRRSRTTPVWASYHELGADALDPRDCGVYSAEAYERDVRVRPFSPDRRIQWVWGYSLRDSRSILVPTRLVYYSARRPEDDFVFECSNGCASGGSMTEAVLFGLLELIERDAFLLAWYGGAELPEIDLGGSRNATLQAMIDRADLAGYDVRAFDTRIDIDVPVVTSLAVRRNGGDGALSFAAAASLDPDTAVQDAVAEVLTYIPELPARVRKRRTKLLAMADDFYRVDELSDHATLWALPSMSRYAGRYLAERPTRSVNDLYRSWQGKRPRSHDLLDDVDYLRTELQDAGFDVIVVDQTAPEQRSWGLHTVSTIVPGLLPIDFGWLRQRALHMPRMFTAFRRAGWRSTDLTETELHRVPHPFP